MENIETQESDTISGYYGPLVVLCSTCSFVVLNRLFDVFGVVPKTAQHKSWRFKNILSSFVHSIITGLWSISCFYHQPKMAEDLISTYSRYSLTLVAISVGYFISDIYDMLMFQRKRESYELVAHHIVVTLCFGSAVVTHFYIGYAVVALIVELNSIFLHLRQLLHMCDFQKDSKLYRLNSLCTVGTFVIFRIATLAWMTRWLVINRSLIPLGFFTLGSLGMAIMTVMNIILFCRLVLSDFINKKVVSKK